MVDQKRREHPPQARDRVRSTWVTVLLVALVVAVIGFGIWAVVAANRADDLEVATDLADDWLAAWNGTDAEAIAALYTADGVHVASAWQLPEAVGREAIVRHAQSYSSLINDARRTGDLVSAGDGMVYRFPIQVVVDGATWDGEVEITLDGELASRVELVAANVAG